MERVGNKLEKSGQLEVLDILEIDTAQMEYQVHYAALKCSLWSCVRNQA